MKKRLSVIGIVLICGIILSACTSKAAATPRLQDSYSGSGGAQPPMATMAPAIEKQVEGETNSATTYDSAIEPSQPGSSGLSAESKRLVIMNADLEIVVDDPVVIQKNITQMATDMGGFVIESYQYKMQTENSEEVPQVKISIRVPDTKLNEALDTIKSYVKDKDKDVRHETVSGQDVTKEYTDLNSRLTNLEEAVKTLRKIMEDTTNTEDTLAVYNQILQKSEEIEVIKGQMKYYEESSSYSKITILISATEAMKPLTVGSWEPTGVAHDALQALINALKFFGTAGIWIVIFVLPVLIIIALPFVFIGLIIRAIVIKRKQKKNIPAATTPASEPTDMSNK